MSEVAPRIEKEVILGKASIIQTFPVHGQNNIVAGCRVESGSVSADKVFRVLRAGDVLWEGSAQSVKQLQQSVRQVDKVEHPTVRPVENASFT